MAVDTKTEIYDHLLPIWNKIRVAAKGQEAVKTKDVQQEYLPCPTDYGVDWYSSMIHRAYWFGATGATLEIYQGSIFRKKPITTIKPESEEVNKLLDKVDSVNNLSTFATNVVEDTLQTSYGGILVDHDDTEGKVLTREQAKEKGIRPRLYYYPAESIFHAEKDQIRLYEKYEVDENDEYSSETKRQIKVLDIFEGAYRQRIYREIETGKTDDKVEWLQWGEDIFPKWPGGKNLEFIPFQFIGAKNNDHKPKNPIIEGLVNANFQHYGLYSDYREALHWIRPFIYATGVGSSDPEDEGSPQVLNSNFMMEYASIDTKLGILEFAGSGLKFDVEALQMLEGQMAAMGAENLRSKKKSSESADKARIDKSGESSILATFANNVSSAITKSVQIMLKWAGHESKSFEYQLNTDYDATQFNAQLMTSINSSVQNQTMSKKTAIWNYQKGELLPDGHSVEDEIEQISIESSGMENIQELQELVRNIVSSMKEETEKSDKNDEKE